MKKVPFISNSAKAEIKYNNFPVTKHGFHKNNFESKLSGAIDRKYENSTMKHSKLFHKLDGSSFDFWGHGMNSFGISNRHLLFG